MLNWAFFLLFTALSGFANAAVTVLFIENAQFTDPNFAWEPGSKFFHVAISYKDQWLHVHPFNGVEITSLDQVLKTGTGGQFLTLRHRPDLSEAEVKSYLGLRFDQKFNWEDPTTVYCAELIGKLLNLSPLPMNFASPIWKQLKISNAGKLGLSPDDLFEILKSESQAEFLPAPPGNDEGHLQCHDSLK